MSDLSESLLSLWIQKLGQRRVGAEMEELQLDDEPRLLPDKANAIVEFYKDDFHELLDLVLEGFDGPYHQTIYINGFDHEEDALAEEVNSLDMAIRTAIDQLSMHLPIGPFPIPAGALAATRKIDAEQIRLLFFVPYFMQFEKPDRAGLTSYQFAIPVSLRLTEEQLFICPITMQSVEWTPILGEEVRRALTTVKSDTVQDNIVSFLRKETGILVGSPVNFSARAVDIMKDSTVDTFEGRLEIGGSEGAPVGETAYKTYRVKDKTIGGMRETMPKEFEQLISATVIPRCQVQFRSHFHGLPNGTVLRLFPAHGKIALGRQVEGADLIEFLKYVTT